MRSFGHGFPGLGYKWRCQDSADTLQWRWSEMRALRNAGRVQEGRGSRAQASFRNSCRVFCSTASTKSS